MSVMQSLVGNKQGFSLIWVAVAVAVIGIVVAASLPGGQLGSDALKNAITKQRMEKIEDATKAFMATNYRRPCPADGTLAPEVQIMALRHIHQPPQAPPTAPPP